MAETITGQYRDKTETESERVATYSLSTSTTGARARARARKEETDTEREIRARARILRVWYEEACMYYQRSFDRKITPNVSRDIADAVAAGIVGDVIRAAMDATQDAPRPSWAYCRAILTRCERDHILTMADWAADRERWQRSRRSNPALQYQQRDNDETYDDEYWTRVTAQTLGLL